MIPLHQHDFLSDHYALFCRDETQNATRAGVCLFVAVRDTHTTTRSDIEAGQLATLVHDSDEPNIVREYIDIIGRWDRNSNFELGAVIRYLSSEKTLGQTFRGK
jgi:hypothetical protein